MTTKYCIYIQLSLDRSKYVCVYIVLYNRLPYQILGSYTVILLLIPIKLQWYYCWYPSNLEISFLINICIQKMAKLARFLIQLILLNIAWEYISYSLICFSPGKDPLLSSSLVTPLTLQIVPAAGSASVDMPILVAALICTVWYTV